MMAESIFAVVAAGMVLGAAGITVATLALKRYRRAKRFPVHLNYGARSSPLPFPQIEVNRQLDDLAREWTPTPMLDLSGLNIQWHDKPYFEVAGKPAAGYYDDAMKVAAVAHGGATYVWQTALAHEAAHYALGQRIDHETTKRPDVFSEADGIVRRARDRSMRSYPRINP